VAGNVFQHEIPCSLQIVNLFAVALQHAGHFGRLDKDRASAGGVANQSDMSAAFLSGLAPQRI
jgi:hypothetical protein